MVVLQCSTLQDKNMEKKEEIAEPTTFYKETDSTAKRLMMLRADPEIRAMKKSGHSDANAFDWDYFTEEQTVNVACRYGAKYGLCILTSVDSMEYADGEAICRAVAIAISCDDSTDRIRSFDNGAFGKDAMIPTGSASTYAKRKALSNLIGLGSSEAEPERAKTTKEKAKTILNMINNAPDAKPTVKMRPAPKVPNANGSKTDVVTKPNESNVAAPKVANKAISATKRTPAKKEISRNNAGFCSKKDAIRAHATRLYQAGRLGDSQAQEIANLIENYTDDKFAEIAQFIQDSDPEHEVI